jgi:hypothetical protein
MKGTGAWTLPDRDIVRQSVLEAYGLLPGQEGQASPGAGETARAVTGGTAAAARTALDNLVDLAAKLCQVPFSVVKVITGVRAAPDRGVRRRTGHLLP